ncbi:MAG: hypothetical protein V1688_01270, partial [bacterium]
AFFSAPKNKIYNGLHILTPGDIYVYFSYLEQTAQGSYLFKNLFTSEITMPTFNIFWLAVGLFGKIFNLNHIITFQLARILLIPICIASLYFLTSYVFESKQIRKITLSVLVFGSGAGALASFLLPSYLSNKTLFYWPMDLWTPEHNTFLTLYHSPHIIASLTLIILIFLFFLKAIEENKYKYSILAGLCGLILIQFHPFHLPTIFLVPAFYVLTKWMLKKNEGKNEVISFPRWSPLSGDSDGASGAMLKETEHPMGCSVSTSVSTASTRAINWQDIKHLFVFYILTVPSVLYYMWLMNFDWAMNLKAFQNHCYTPRFFVVLTSYGGLIIFGLVGILLSLKYFYNKKYPISNIRQPISDNKLLFLLVWAITQFTLIFMPFRFQRRLTEGLQISLTFLTIMAAVYLKEKFKKSPFNIFFNKFSLIIIFILVFTLSNLFVVKMDMEYFSEKNRLFYFDEQQIESYKFLKNEVSCEDVILSGIINGNAIPGVAGRKVYLGHVNVETLYYDSKLAYAQWFFKDNGNDEKKINFLQENNIKYIYYSEYEKEMGNFQPAEKSYLEQIFVNGFAIIYKIKS